MFVPVLLLLLLLLLFVEGQEEIRHNRGLHFRNDRRMTKKFCLKRNIQEEVTFSHMVQKYKNYTVCTR